MRLLLALLLLLAPVAAHAIPGAAMPSRVHAANLTDHNRNHNTWRNQWSGYFDGVNDVWTRADHASLEPGATLSVSVWVRRDSATPSVPYILSKSTSFVFYLSTSTPALLISPRSVWGATIIGAGGVWSHLAVVYDGAQAAEDDRVRFYVNGASQARTYGGSSTIPASIVDNASPWTISAASSNTWNGYIDELATWRAVLTQADVSALYAAGRPTNVRSLNLSAAPTTMVLYYRAEGCDGLGTVATYPTIPNCAPNMSSFPATAANGSQADFQAVVP